MQAPEPIPDAQSRREIAARAICDDRTIRRAYRGDAVKPASHERIRRAAVSLGLPLPPARSRSR
jgi:hypothetical protein